MIVEVWGTQSRNLVASFDDEAAAVAFVRQILRDHGASYVARLALAREDENGRSETIAIDRSLVELAREAERQPGTTPVALRPA